MMQSCNLDIDTNVDLQKEEFFFSTDKFFNGELDRLSSKIGFTKYVNFNGKEERIKLDKLNLAQEFIPFINSDINKLIWSDQYSCDSTFNEQQLIRLKCICSNPKLKTQLLGVDLMNGNVSSIHIENKMSKMLMETSEYLDYKKDEFYQIRRIQELRTDGLDSTLVRVTF